MDIKMKEIPVNIWDDYWDDNTGKKQETFIFVEDTDPDEKKHLESLLRWINKNVNLARGC